VPDDDDGWGGTVDEGWSPTQPGGPPPGSPPPPHPSSPPPPGAPGQYGPSSRPGPPGPGFRDAPVPGYGAPPPSGRPPAPASGAKSRTPLLVGGAAAVVVAVAVVLVIVLTSGGDTPKKKAGSTTPPVTNSAAPLSSGASGGGGGGSGLLAAAPFSGCVTAPKASYNTSSVTDQIACTGSAVQSAVSAQGVSFAQFPDDASLQSWYSQTILQTNGITQNAGDCTSGTTVNTTAGAVYCEGPFTDSSGGSARQLVVQAPATVTLSNGPNTSSADCPGSAFTLLAFTSPSDHVGVIALTCSSTADAGNGLESALKSGAFALHH
jgi:hypothetical protein